VNTDTNIAAWMIAGGTLAQDPTEARNRAHRFALATGSANDRPTVAARIGAALASLRSHRIETGPANSGA